MKTVHVVGNDQAVVSMFMDEGWQVFTDSDAMGTPMMPDLVCFTGGSDVTPTLYLEPNIASHTSPSRDLVEIGWFTRYETKCVPMVGICRGGQFLNVMSGGRMLQHIEGHSMGSREIESTEGGTVTVEEDHHQGIVPPSWASVLYHDPRDGNPEVIFYRDIDEDYSVVPKLAFQPHPEWDLPGSPSCVLFFHLIDTLLLEAT